MKTGIDELVALAAAHPVLKNDSNPPERFFLFYIFLKIKFQKYMSVLKYFKNIPRSSPHRATGPNYNFFS